MPDSTKRAEASEELRQKLQHLGLKWTLPRHRIFDVLLHTQDHLSVEEIHQALEKIGQKTAVATVYRTVHLFESLGLLARLDLGDGVERFELIQSAHRHHHLLCTQCHSVTEIPMEILTEWKEKIMRDVGFQIDDKKITFSGICRICQLKE